MVFRRNKKRRSRFSQPPRYSLFSICRVPAQLFPQQPLHTLQHRAGIERLHVRQRGGDVRVLDVQFQLHPIQAFRRLHLGLEDAVKRLCLHRGDALVQIPLQRVIVQVRQQRQAVVEDRAEAEGPCLLVSQHSQVVGVPVLVEEHHVQFQQQGQIRPNGNIVTAKWLYLYLSQRSFRWNCQQHMTGSAGQKRVPPKFLASCEIPVPTISEQERIVSKIEELFSRLDASVAELQAAKEKLSAYRQAVLKEAFANSTRTELVEMSEIAEDIRIGPFGTMLHKSDYISDGVPVINPQHIKNLSILPSRKITVSQEMAVELSSYRLRENDIIMGRRGEMGRAAAITKSEAGWICGTGSLLFRLKPEYDASFYAQILSSPDIVHYLEDHATGTTMKNLNEHRNNRF